MRRIFVIVLFFYLLGCQAHADESESQPSNELQKYKVKSNEVEIDGLIYTQNIIKGYLDLIVFPQEDVFDRNFHADNKVLSYFISAGEYEEIEKAGDNYLNQISELTGLQLDKQDKESIEDAQYIWLYLSHPELILDYPYVVELWKSPNRKGGYYSYIMGITFEIDGFKKSFSGSAKKVKTPTTIRDNFIYESEDKDASETSEVIKYISRNYYSYGYRINIDDYIKNIVFTELLVNLAPVRIAIIDMIVLTSTHQEVVKSNEIHPLDKAFLKALFSDDFLPGMTREDSIDWLSAEIFRLIKSNEVR